MAHQHLVRFGALSLVGRFRSVDAVRYPRRSRVILRTPRGLEVGQVLAQADSPGGAGDSDGRILRRMTVEDELLQARLEKNRQAAFEACSARLGGLGVHATLMEVEHLFDGRTLLFYFLGETSLELEQLTDELAQTYEAEVQFHRFSELVSEGCGPGCGTEDAVGRECKTCSTGCAVASVCSTRRA